MRSGITTTEPASSRRGRRWWITALAPSAALALGGAGLVALSGCEQESSLEEAAEETGDAVEDGIEETGDAIEDATDDLGGG